MVTNRIQHSFKGPVKQGPGEAAPQPKKIGASTPFNFTTTYRAATVMERSRRASLRSPPPKLLSTPVAPMRDASVWPLFQHSRQPQSPNRVNSRLSQLTRIDERTD